LLAVAVLVPHRLLTAGQAAAVQAVCCIMAQKLPNPLMELLFL
tara:strand:+ start:186 stop:314 length:129 start_codon:yes stop_codon:yes gene_type:complete